MQIVKWGKKQRQVKVPVGWAFVKDGKPVKDKDKFFNLHTHAWDNAEDDDIGITVGGPDGICVAIREEHRAHDSEIDKDPRAVRIVGEID